MCSGNKLSGYEEKEGDADMFKGGSEGGSYQPLAQSEIDMLHKASMKVFQEVGMEVHSKRALEIFAAAGAEVDFSSQRVRASESWIMDIVQRAPAQVTLCGREEKYDLVLGEKTGNRGLDRA